MNENTQNTNILFAFGFLGLYFILKDQVPYAFNQIILALVIYFWSTAGIFHEFFMYGWATMIRWLLKQLVNQVELFTLISSLVIILACRGAIDIAEPEDISIILRYICYGIAYPLLFMGCLASLGSYTLLLVRIFKYVRHNISIITKTYQMGVESRKKIDLDNNSNKGEQNAS